MELLNKKPWLIYLLCFLIAAGPGFFVWFNYPSIESKDPERRETQLIYISFISLLPFIGVLSFFFYRAFKNYLLA